LRREVVGVELRGVDAQPTGAAGPIHGDDARRTFGAGDRHGHAGRGLVVGQGVQVDVVARHGKRVGAHRRVDDLRLVEMRRGFGRGRELGRELTEGQVLTASLDETERGRVPERGGAPVAQHDLVAVGQGEELRQP
jgi:hypothetical protein